MSGFEKLPREIRDIIYELCLCLDGILIPYPDLIESEGEKIKSHELNVALLALNKQIREEALPILFGKNTWRITANEVDLAENHASSLEDGTIDTLWHRYGSHIQNVDLKYMHTIFPPEALTDAIHYAHQTLPGNRGQRADNIHANARMELYSCWETIGAALGCCQNIKSLNIDIADLYCPIGCCRKEIVRNLFRRSEYLAPVEAEVEVSVSGVHCEKEREFVLMWRTRCMSGEEKDEATVHTQVHMYKWDG